MNFSRRNQTLIFYISISLIFFYIIATAGMGPDHLKYESWIHYFSSFDIKKLSQFPVAQNGLPNVIWSFEPGLLSYLFFEITGLTIFQINFSELTFLLSQILGVINLYLVFRIVKLHAIEESSILISLLIFLIFTPAGYYINKFSSESFSIFFTLSIIYLWETVKFAKLRDQGVNIRPYLILIGICAYFMILLRITNIFPLLVILVIFLLNNKYNKNIYFEPVKILAPIIIATLAIVVSLCYNQIVLDNPLKTAYQFGDGKFSSISLGNNKYYEVLFSSWHGLFIYSPVLFYFLFHLVKKSIASTLPNKLITLSIILLVLMQTILQGSWFFWWMGLGTYGARGFVITGLLISYIFLLNYDFKGLCSYKIELSFLKFIVIALIISYQSYLFGLGITNFLKFGLIDAPFSTNILEGTKFILLLLISSVLIVTISFGLKNKQKLTFALKNHFYFTLIIALSFVLADRLNYNLWRLTPLLYLLGISFLFNKFFSKLLLFTCVGFFLISVFFNITHLKHFSDLRETNFTKNNNQLDCLELIDSYNEYVYYSDVYRKEHIRLLEFLKRSRCV